jgi:phosphate-selective porin OprO/OprP
MNVVRIANGIVCLLLAFVASASLGVVRADEAASEREEPRTVEERLDEVDQRVKIMERKAELEKEAADAAKKDAASAGAGKDGFVFKSADGAFKLRVRGVVQGDARFWADDELKPNVDTFLVRRARPIVEGTVYKYFDFRIMPDFGGGTTTLQDAYVEAKLGKAPLRFRAGKYKVPFSLSRLQSDPDTLFTELALTGNLSPNRDEGFQLSGDHLDGVIGWQAAAMNGVVDAGSADIDTDDNKETVLRVFVHPFKKTNVSFLKGLGLGAAASAGTRSGTLTSTGVTQYRTPSLVSFFAYRTGATLPLTVVADGDLERLSPQIYWYWKRLGFLAEQVTSTQHLTLDTTSAEIENEAWQAEASFLLTPDVASFSTISPKKGVGDPASPGKGAFQIGVRYSKLEIDDDAFPVFANPTTQASEAETTGVVFNWFLNRFIKVAVDLEETKFKGGAATGDRETEKVLINRVQISF